MGTMKANLGGQLSTEEGRMPGMTAQASDFKAHEPREAASEANE